jgi:two-component system response regulator FlrC
MSGKVIHTSDLRMKKVLDMAESVAGSRATVLIYGESGTGKELLARFIHTKSNRAHKEFVALNCAAVPEGLLESELFGHEKGSFTSADQRKIGKFEMANQSTFLLDEVSEMPMLLQSKILRVLQEGEIERVGGGKPISIDVRIIAATNKNLADLVRQGLFREDLYYRLNVIPVEIPALRERPKDIESLAQLFVEMSCANNELPMKKLSAESLAKLATWRWPGNVRELENVLERSVLLAKNNVIEPDEVLIDNYIAQDQSHHLRAGMTVSQAEKMLIIKTLEYTSQNRTQAAHLLGISIRTLRNKLNEYKLEGHHEFSIW